MSEIKNGGHIVKAVPGTFFVENGVRNLFYKIFVV